MGAVSMAVVDVAPRASRGTQLWAVIQVAVAAAEPRRHRRQRPSQQETREVQSSSSRDHAAHSCDEAASGEWSPMPGSAWANTQAEQVDAKVRLTRLAKTLECDVIPRLVGAHAKAANTPHQLQPQDIAAFVALLREASDSEINAAVNAAHRGGMPVEAIFLELLAPAARRLGEMWTADQCDFATVTICLGRLQRLLREWSPEFGRAVEHPPNGRRVLLAQHPDEQHSFGLSMVAEFFRRDGWEVLGGVGGAVPDPSRQVSRDWFDVVGFSIGGESRLDWLKERITQVRAASRNRAVVVLVGGPLFATQPALAQAVGADASGHQGGSAPKLAEDLLTARLLSR
jgi:MerR family transcriptional regulator, light-induced transcriptional regulator